MKHHQDLSRDEAEQFTDRLGGNLAEMLNKEMVEHKMCPICLHKTVIVMCHAYLARMEDEIEPHDTVN